MLSFNTQFRNWYNDLQPKLDLDWTTLDTAYTTLDSRGHYPLFTHNHILQVFFSVKYQNNITLINYIVFLSIKITRILKTNNASAYQCFG